MIEGRNEWTNGIIQVRVSKQIWWELDNTNDEFLWQAYRIRNFKKSSFEPTVQYIVRDIMPTPGASPMQIVAELELKYRTVTHKSQSNNNVMSKLNSFWID